MPWKSYAGLALLPTLNATSPCVLTRLESTELLLLWSFKTTIVFIAALQAGESFPITVLFKPRASILQQCSRFLVEPGSGVLEIPMKVGVTMCTLLCLI
jgi:hypothetical protein